MARQTELTANNGVIFRLTKARFDGIFAIAIIEGLWGGVGCWSLGGGHKNEDRDSSSA